MRVSATSADIDPLTPVVCTPEMAMADTDDGNARLAGIGIERGFEIAPRNIEIFRIGGGGEDHGAERRCRQKFWISDVPPSLWFV